MDQLERSNRLRHCRGRLANLYCISVNPQDCQLNMSGMSTNIAMGILIGIAFDARAGFCYFLALCALDLYLHR